MKRFLVNAFRHDSRNDLIDEIITELLIGFTVISIAVVLAVLIIN